MVIQRWQSVLLLVVAVMMGCFSFFSLGQVAAPDFTLNFTTLGFSFEGEATTGGFSGNYLSTWYFFAISLLATLLPFINIFCFKNLKMQKRLCSVEAVLIIALCATGASLAYSILPENASISWSPNGLAGIIALIADIMAYRMIESDRRRISAADRIR